MNIMAIHIFIVPFQIKDSRMKKLFIANYVKPMMEAIIIHSCITKTIQSQVTNESFFQFMKCTRGQQCQSNY